MSLRFFDEPLQYLKGVGPYRGDVLKSEGLSTYRDLLSYYPRRYLDRSNITPIRGLREGLGNVTVVGIVRGAGIVPSRRKRRYEAVLEDEAGGVLHAVWFQRLHWVSRVFQPGDRVALHGKPQRYSGVMTMTHPDFDKLDAETPSLDTGRIIALYPGTAALASAGISSRTFRKLVYRLLKERGKEIPEIMPASVIEKHGLLDGRVAIRAIHFPRSRAELEQARIRLKFEELFFIQVMLARMRATRRRNPGPMLDGKSALFGRLTDEVLPFTLTMGQQAALRDITADATSGFQMNRLIQGDVGCGKTVVAVGAICRALDSDFQCAFMAPTEILAEQHYLNLTKYLAPLGISVRLLVGNQRKSVRSKILNEIALGDVGVVVGTHALIQETVKFKRLGLVVVDEQHRFGVIQRAQIQQKGANPHILLMTATPIPRSLAMTLYGDLDVTVIRDRPAGRKPVTTLLRYESQRDDVVRLVRRELDAGRQAYVVYPLVEESEKLDLKDAESGLARLKEVFAPLSVSLLHGRMKSTEKEDVMGRFKDGTTHVLVATTVVEVGVDVPNATVMLIEHAERFGLSQLHQLRGRVGRGAEQSYCILLSDYKRSAEAIERLDAMISTSDGFRISELDLKLRGAGDFFGTRQSGMPELKIADIVADVELLQKAKVAARRLLDDDPDLNRPENDITGDYFRRYCVRQDFDLARVG